MGLTSLKTPQKFSVDGLGELGVKNFRLASRFVEGFLLRIQWKNKVWLNEMSHPLFCSH
jgi:hypothetical protein